MPELTISEVARQVGLQAIGDSVLRENWIASPGPRMSGQRRYDTTALYRLAIIQRARQLGFTLTEIRHLFLWFPWYHSRFGTLGERSPKESLPSWMI